MKAPKITAYRKWDIDSVRKVCINYDLYTCGDCDEYSNMLDMVRDLEPTYDNIYTVAKDIAEHSKYYNVWDVMSFLETCAVTTSFDEIDDDDNC